MKSCRLVGLPSYRGTLEGLTTLWRAGEERELSESAAGYMLATFPGSIEVATVAPAMEAPLVDKAMRSPRKG